MSPHTRKTSILYLNVGSRLGGAERSLLDVLTFIDKGRFRPLVACPEGPLSDRLREMGISVRQTRFEPLRSPAKFIRELHGLHGYALENAVDIIHSNSTLSIKHAMFLGKSLRIPSVAHIRDCVTKTESGWAFFTWLYFVDRVVAISRSVAQALPYSRTLHHTQVIYNGIDTQKFVPVSDAAAIRSRLGLPPNALVIGTVGRFGAEKGMSYFVEAAHLLLRQFPHLRFLMVGGAVFPENVRYQDEAIKKIRELHLEDRLLCTGDREDIQEVMNALDIVVVPSLREGFGRVAAEAGACGKPVIATHVGGLSEVIDDARTGILVPPADAQALSNAIGALVGNEARRMEMGSKARRHVCEFFDVRRTVREVESLYGSLLNG